MSKRNWITLGSIIIVAIVTFVVGWVAGPVLHLYPAEWLSWVSGGGSRPVVDTSAVAEWQGEWDSFPAFWAAYQEAGSSVLTAVPAEYAGLPLPRRPGEYIFIGGSQPWRGLQVTLDIPNTVASSLTAEHWDGQAWRRDIFDGTHDNYATLNKSGKITFSTGVERALVVNGQSITTYWVRFSVDVELSPDLDGWTTILHNSPTVLVDKIELKAHRRTACENRPGLKMIRVTVVDADGSPIPGVKVGFDVEDSRGIAYDHPNVWGKTDENGYLEWDNFGVPTVYGIWINGTQAVGNIRTDFGYEYCSPPGTTHGGWRPVNRPGVYSWDLEITVK